MSYAPQLRDSSIVVRLGSRGNTSKHSQPSCAAAPLRWADTSMSVRAAAIRPSLTIRAGTGTALGARARRATAGWMREAPNYCPCPMPMSFLHFRTNWRHWPCKTNGLSTVYCSAAVPRRFWKSQRIPVISALRSVSSAFFTPGTRSFSIILMSTVLWLPEVCLRITRGGFSPGAGTSFSHSRSSARSFAASSPMP